jgi:hypothetical protein
MDAEQLFSRELCPVYCEHSQVGADQAPFLACRNGVPDFVVGALKLAVLEAKGVVSVVLSWSQAVVRHERSAAMHLGSEKDASQWLDGLQRSQH